MSPFPSGTFSQSSNLFYDVIIFYLYFDQNFQRFRFGFYKIIEGIWKKPTFSVVFTLKAINLREGKNKFMNTLPNGIKNPTNVEH